MMVWEESFHPPEEESETAQSLSYLGKQGQDQALSYRGKQGHDQALSYRGRQEEVIGPLPKGLARRSPSRTLLDQKMCNMAEEQEVPKAHNRPSYSGTVAKIMSQGGFRVKYMVRNGKNMPEILELYGGSVLGLPWDTAKDVIVINMHVNLSARKQGVRLGQNLRPEEEDHIKNAVLTRRVLMSQVHGIYDPLGLLSPITVKFKLVLQHLVQAEVDWDEPLEGDLREEAESALKEMLRSSAVSFPRCVLGEECYTKGWMLLGFGTEETKPPPAACMQGPHSG